jgi:penicillin-binding protein 2
VKLPRRDRRLPIAVMVGIVALTACAAPGPDPTPVPTPAPRGDVADAVAIAAEFLDAWHDRRFGAMHRLVAPVDRERHDLARLSGLLGDFHAMAGVTGMAWEAAEPMPIVLPPQPVGVPTDGPEATPTPSSSPPPASAPPSSSGEGGPPRPTATAEPTPEATPVPPGTPRDGPVPALAVDVDLRFSTRRFGEVSLDRQLVLIPSGDTWHVRWSPRILFPYLQDEGTLVLERSDPVRGRIVSGDGTVFAMTRDDGVRVYPQEWLAGQTIGYVGEISTEERVRLRFEEYRDGDQVGLAGLELGAERLLRGYPGFRLVIVQPSGSRLTALDRPMLPGADVVTTLRPDLQATAEAAIAGYAEAATAVVDPKSGDVWALASAPLFNPNAMTLGTTLGGVALAAPTASQRTNHAIGSAYPAGSSFKPFTLAAALQTGVASPATRMSCNGTWTYSGFTFHNYLDHQLSGLVSLPQAMAFSCNTTYMPLSIMVYEADATALTDLVAEFGFGQSSGMRFLADEPGILPDAAYFEVTERWDGRIVAYNGFDQIQLAIGQGSYLGTALQLANAYAAFGNGGRLWVPRIVVEARLPDGTVVERDDPTLKRDVSLTDEQLAYVIESMKAVVNLSYGTAYPAFAGFGIQVAGKSGTAETGTPTPDAWFPAVAPADDPTISVATVLVHVALATGGSDAAPLVRRVMAAHFSGGPL